MGAFADEKVDRMFPLASADIVIPNLPVRGLNFDFQILSQVARVPDASSSSLAQRALKACNDIMSSFAMPENDDSKALDEMINRCRRIGWEVLGQLDEKSLQATVVWDRENRDAQVWGIGHW